MRTLKTVLCWMFFKINVNPRYISWKFFKNPTRHYERALKYTILHVTFLSNHSKRTSVQYQYWLGFLLINVSHSVNKRPISVDACFRCMLTATVSPIFSVAWYIRSGWNIYINKGMLLIILLQWLYISVLEKIFDDKESTTFSSNISCITLKHISFN